MRNLDGQQVRQLIDVKQLYETLIEAERSYDHSFKGAISWKKVHGHEYLYRKRGEEWRSLGARSPETELAYAQFKDGRRAIKERIASLKLEIERMAPISRAMGLGRMPSISARILRRLDRQGIIGNGLSVVGTRALFAYESLVSAHFEPDQLAAQDIDLLYDARASLKMVAPELQKSGLLRQLKNVDRSFSAKAGSFRAANDSGFLVELIMPQRKQAAAPPPRRQIGPAEDQAAADIEGLSWLQGSPVISEIVIDEKGLPAGICVPDPRAFAVHKAWLSERPDREAGKRRRDIAQAHAVAEMVHQHLPAMPFEEEALLAFPAAVRARSISLLGSVVSTKAPVRASDW